MTPRNVVCYFFQFTVVYMDIIRHTITDSINSRAYGHLFLKNTYSKTFQDLYVAYCKPYNHLLLFMPILVIWL